MDTPKEAFASSIEIALELADDLKDILGQLSEPCPADVQWEDAADAQHVVLTLEGLIKHLMRDDG